MRKCSNENQVIWARTSCQWQQRKIQMFPVTSLNSGWALWWLNESPQRQWDLSLCPANVISFIQTSGSLPNQSTLESVIIPPQKKKIPGVGVWHKKTSSHCLEASSETCEAPAPENNTVAQALLGERLIPMFLVTPQGFGYQTFLDWRACPGHTAHQPGECDRCGLGLWVYRSLPLCSGECHTAGPRHLAVHQQAPGKPLCISSAGEWPGSCSQPALSRSWTSGLFIPDFSFYPLSIQAWPCHHFSSSFRVLTFSGKKSQLSAAFPVQNKPIVCLGSSQIHIHWTVFCWEILSRKLEGVRFEAIIYLLWASDRLPTMWKYPHVSHSVRAKCSWTRLLQSGWWILVLTSYM